MATKVFISWGGELSNRLANALRNWLPSALQFVKPYFSPDDIEKGAKWHSEISLELQNSNFGIICLTKDNTERPWVIFEAGALSKFIDKGRVCPLLFDVEPSDIKGPLTSFQGTIFQKDDFRRLFISINNSGGELALDVGVLDSVYDMWWPKLEKEVNSILSEPEQKASKARRPEREILDEILQLTRMTSEKIVRPVRISASAVEELLDRLEKLLFIIRVEHSSATAGSISKGIIAPLQHICVNTGHSDLFKKFIFGIEEHPARLDELRSNSRKEREEKKAAQTPPVEDDIPF
jgi:hypothetical protein